MADESQLQKMGLSTKKRKSVFISLVFVNIIRNMSNYSVIIGLPEFVLELAGTLALYGVVIGILQITQTFLQIPMSTLSDKIGRRKAIVIGYIIHLIGQALAGFSTQIWQLILFRAIQGAGVFASVIFATLTDMYDDKERARRFSLYSVSLTIGYLLGNVLGGIIADYIPLNYLFFISALLNFFAFLFLMLILPETNPLEKRLKEREKRALNDYLGVKRSSNNRSLPFIFSLVIHGIRNFFFSGFLALQIWNYRTMFSLNGTQTALLLLPLTAFYIGGLIIGPIIGKKINYFFFIIITSSFLAVMLIIISFSSTDLWFYLSLNLLLAIVLAMQDPINTSYITNHMDESRRGLGTGILSTVGLFSSALGQIGISGLAEIVHFQWLHIISGCFWLLIVGIILLVNYEIKKKEKRKNNLSS